MKKNLLTATLVVMTALSLTACSCSGTAASGTASTAVTETAASETTATATKESATTKAGEDKTTRETATNETSSARETDKTSETTAETTSETAAAPSGTTEPQGGSGNSGSGSTGSGTQPSGGNGGNSGGSSGGGSSSPAKETQPAAQHTHNWVAQYRNVYHKATGHYEDVWVETSPAWDEVDDVYEGHDVCDCGLDFDAAGMSSNEINAHLGADMNKGYAGGYGTMLVYVRTDIIHHDAQGYYERTWFTDSDGWTEKVLTGYACSCGATR